MKKQDLKIGQTIYVKPTGNASRRSSQIKETVIEFIGSKYFELKGFNNRFNIETGQMDCSPYISDGQAYISMQEIEDEKELSKGIQNIKNNAHLLSLEQVRAVLKHYGLKADL